MPTRLRRSQPLDPGLRRLRHGRGFRYADAAGLAAGAMALLGKKHPWDVEHGASCPPVR